MAPTVRSISPASVVAGSGALSLTLTGTNFLSTTTVQVGGVPDPATLVDSTQLTATVAASQLIGGGPLAVIALNGSASSGTATPITLTVTNPVAAITQIAPPSVLAGAAPATLTVSGTGFVPASVVEVNGSGRTTAFVSGTQLTFQLAPADVATPTVLGLTVVNPAPGGGVSGVAALGIVEAASAPVITLTNPTQFVAGSGDTPMWVFGSNLYELVEGESILTSTVFWNGTALAASASENGYYTGEVVALVPASLLTSAGSATITVSSTASTPALSNALTVTVTNPPMPTLSSIVPSSGPILTSALLTLNGTGFVSRSTVQVNGTTVPATYVSPSELTVNLPASSVALPGRVTCTVTTAAPGGGTTVGLPYTAYLGLPNNDMVYNPSDGLLYASVPDSAGGGLGNSVVGIDPVSGNLARQFWAGSNPDKLALSSDGTQLFVGLDGAAAVAQIKLKDGSIVQQFSLGGGPGVYNPPYTAIALAAVPGLPNAVAVATAGGYPMDPGVTIYDSGVARAKTSVALGYGSGALTFGATAATLYMAGSTSICKLTVDATGIAGGSTLGSTSGNVKIQYDNGRLYLSSGVVFDTSTGMQVGTFYASSSTPAAGPVVADSGLGLAFLADGSGNGTGPEVLVFNVDTFLPTGSIPLVSEANGSYGRLVRWGQNGLALNTPTQIYIFRSPVVKDLSTMPADLAVTLHAPSTATTGSPMALVATVVNLGPNPALANALVLTLDASLMVNSVTASQGTCGSGTTFACDLGNLASGASATVTINATPTTAGTVSASASATSVSYDPTVTNNQATATTTVTGPFYAPAPAIAGIVPALVQAGSGPLSLTVAGSGFNANSEVMLGGVALATTLVSSTQLIASVPAQALANYGWAPVTVTNPAPGGGTAQAVPLTIYALLNIPANAMVFDPYGQKLYATIPSASTTITGNAIVAIDPFQASAGTPIPIGSEPGVMAATTDGNYLWIGVRGANSLVKFDLLQQAVTATIPLSYSEYGTSFSTYAIWLAAMPGSDGTLAIDIADSGGIFGIFDVAGDTGSFRTNFSGTYQGINPVFADATRLYAYDSQTTGAEFYRYGVDGNGVTLEDGTTLNGLGGFNGSFSLADGLVYGGAGGIIQPSSNPPMQIATLFPVAYLQADYTTRGVGVVPDPSLQKVFMMVENLEETLGYALARYDMKRYLAEAWLPMPASASSELPSWQMLRFGQDGLALLPSGPGAGSGQDVNEILLLRGPFVTPQLLQVDPAASLTSSSEATLAQGTGNTLLTLAGSNFLPGVAVTWNGAYRTTTLVDASHLVVALPASDLAKPGSGSLVATNPGAPASNALIITID